MSTTGNLLFPEDDDGGWVTSIIKALPEDKPPPVPELTPEQMHIDDPVAIQADSAFSSLAAENANREAIFAAGWSADVVGAEKATPPTPAELGALDAAIAHEAGNALFGVIDDPVAASADATFSQMAADVANRQAIEAAGWSAGTVRSVGAPAEAHAQTALTPEAVGALDSVIAREAGNPDLAAFDDPVAAEADARFAERAAEQATRDALADAGWAAKPETEGGQPTPAEMRALDAALQEHAGDDRLAGIPDPVAIAADARFAETAADVATAEAIGAARAAAEAAPGAPLSTEELRTLDEIASRVGDIEARFAAEDPVAIEAEAAFAERAAEQAIADAIFAAQWHPRAVSADTLVADILRERGVKGLQIEDLVRAEAEIAFDDAAHDLAYAAVDNLATGEAAALAAFDQAIAAGADPEEALQLAIAAAEELDPRAFGGLTRVATLPVATEDAGLPPPRAEVPSVEIQPLADLTARPDLAPPPAFTVAAVGQGFIAVTGEPLLLGAAGTDTLAAPSFQFLFDPSVISAPGSHFRAIDREDLILIPKAAIRNPVAGTGDDDFLVGSDGNDAIGGREGDDFIYGDRPTNYDPAIHDVANPLTDPVFGIGGDDVISGGAGADSIWGGPGNDIIDGDVTDGSGISGLIPFSLGATTVGDDTIHGGDGNDTIYGGGGADTLYGDAGKDNIFGYAGNDILVGGPGNDTLTGGAGADQFRFEGGSGATPLAHAQSLGTDVVKDFSEADGDTFALSNADFGLGAAGTLTDGSDYFEHAPAALTDSPIDASGGTAGPAIVVFGDAAGSDGVAVYYTDDASAMTKDNSYQVADVKNINLAQIDGGDFTLKA